MRLSGLGFPAKRRQLDGPPEEIRHIVAEGKDGCVVVALGRPISALISPAAAMFAPIARLMLPARRRFDGGRSRCRRRRLHRLRQCCLDRGRFRNAWARPLPVRRMAKGR